MLHVPGHTPEHLTLLVTDSATASEPMGAFTGDFIFVGDVGRPDLLERAARVRGTMQESARQLFRSLQRFRTQPDYLQIWPGHGAGSACGKSLGAVPQTTLGYEKRFNWAFGITDESEFVRAVLAGQPEPPRYFAEMKRINQAGPRLLGGIRRPARLPVGHACQRAGAGCGSGGHSALVGVRAWRRTGNDQHPGQSGLHHLGGLAPRPMTVTIYLIIDDRRGHTVDELVRDLAGIGLDRLAGYFGTDTIDAWRTSRGQLQTIPSLGAEATERQQLQYHGTAGRAGGRGVECRPHAGVAQPAAGRSEQRLDEIPLDRSLIVHCQSGARAAIAASLLQARGFPDVRLFAGGFAEWRAAG